jgi:hypothetical protein
MTPDYRAGFEACLELLLKHDEIGSMFCQGTARDIAEEIRIEGGLCTDTEFMELRGPKMDSVLQIMDDKFPRKFVHGIDGAMIVTDIAPGGESKTESFANWVNRHTLTKG